MRGMEYIHTEFPRPPAWLGPVPERVGKRQPVAAGNLRERELKMAGCGVENTNTQMHRRIAVLRHSHSTTVPTLSLLSMHNRQRLEGLDWVIEKIQNPFNFGFGF